MVKISFPGEADAKNAWVLLIHIKEIRQLARKKYSCECAACAYMANVARGRLKHIVEGIPDLDLPTSPRNARTASNKELEVDTRTQGTLRY